MSTLQVELPDQLATELRSVVQAGWFADEKEILLTALREFLRGRRWELAERFQQEDIQWALQTAKSRP